MKNFRAQDLLKIKNSLLTEEDLSWLYQQIKKLHLFLKSKNKCREDDALKLVTKIKNIFANKEILEIKIYDTLALIQFYFQQACGKNNLVWSLFYNNLCDQKILLMNRNSEHHTFARGLATILQVIENAIPNLNIARISESGKKQLDLTLPFLDEDLPSTKDIIQAKNWLVYF